MYLRATSADKDFVDQEDWKPVFVATFVYVVVRSAVMHGLDIAQDGVGYCRIPLLHCSYRWQDVGTLNIEIVIRGRFVTAG